MSLKYHFLVFFFCVVLLIFKNKEHLPLYFVLLHCPVDWHQLTGSFPLKFRLSAQGGESSFTQHPQAFQVIPFVKSMSKSIQSPRQMADTGKFGFFLAGNITMRRVYFKQSLQICHAGNIHPG